VALMLLLLLLVVLGRFEGLRTGAGYSSAKPIWVDQMDSKVRTSSMYSLKPH
jgi:hypothetical protein